MTAKIANIPVPGTLCKVFLNRRLRSPACKSIALIFYNFFFCQYRAALFGGIPGKGKIPVSQVDHEADKKIPFTPRWIKIYLDFAAFWVRILGFLLGEFKEGALPGVTGIIDSMGKLYAFAGEVYKKNLSTTRRPFYIRGFRFFAVHFFDPHLMCIPSLHVMVVICAYTQFTRIMKNLNSQAPLADQRVAEIRRGARDITEAVLYVKQHSVNCVAAAMYAMTRFDPELFPPEEAEDFASRLFTRGGTEAKSPADDLPRMDIEAADLVRKHIVELYRLFLSQAASSAAPREEWARPLLDFLASCPKH